MKVLAQFFDGKKLLVFVVLVLNLAAALSAAATAQPTEATKQQIILQAAQDWIRVGKEQYSRRLYEASEQSFLRALEYQEHLTAAECEKINELLEMARTAQLERKRVLEHIQTADSLIKQEQPIKAKAHLEKVKDGKFLTQDQQRQVAESLKKIDNQLKDEKKETTELYTRSVKFYNAGQLEKAREGFVKVAQNGLLTMPAGRTAEDYLVKIDDVLVQKAQLSSPIGTEPVEKAPESDFVVIENKLSALEVKPSEKTEQQVVQEVVEEPSVPAAVGAEPPTIPDRHVESVDTKRNIVQSYIKAVVSDVSARVQAYIGEGQFDKAKEAVESAEQILIENRPKLGEELFNQYSSQLAQLAERIAKAKGKWWGNWDNRSAWKL